MCEQIFHTKNLGKLQNVPKTDPAPQHCFLIKNMQILGVFREKYGNSDPFPAPVAQNGSSDFTLLTICVLKLE